MPPAKIWPIGRFAPSPTGALHFGSLVAAVASYLAARSSDGLWRLRIDDLDQTRERPGAADQIIRTLAGFGFQWDGEIVYQSRQTDAYRSVLDRLIEADRVYRCDCSRKQIAQAGLRSPDGGWRYPGHCRNRGLALGDHGALRVRLDEGQSIRFVDRYFGEIHSKPASEYGDFVIRRADGFFAYQLAVVVDDLTQGVNQVIRGADLLDSSSRQIVLHELLGLDVPEYGHVPLVVDSEGRKLSKQDADAPIHPGDATAWLKRAAEYLGQSVDPSIDDVDTFWAAAIAGFKTVPVPPIERPAGSL